MLKTKRRRITSERCCSFSDHRLHQQEANGIKMTLTSFDKLLSCGDWKLLSSPSKPGPSPCAAFFFSTRVYLCSSRQFS
jgi:hypothetical protein